MIGYIDFPNSLLIGNESNKIYSPESKEDHIGA